MKYKYLEYIYFRQSIPQTYFDIYVFNKNTPKLYWYTKLLYLKSAKLEQLILHFSFVDVQLNI